jgi:hypothetical protein
LVNCSRWREDPVSVRVTMCVNVCVGVSKEWRERGEAHLACANSRRTGDLPSVLHEQAGMCVRVCVCVCVCVCIYVCVHVCEV